MEDKQKLLGDDGSIRDSRFPSARSRLSNQCLHLRNTWHFKDFWAKPSAFFIHSNKSYGTYTLKFIVLPATPAAIHSVFVLVCAIIYLLSRVSGAEKGSTFSCVNKRGMYLHSFQAGSRKLGQKYVLEFAQLGNQILLSTDTKFRAFIYVSALNCQLLSIQASQLLLLWHDPFLEWRQSQLCPKAGVLELPNARDPLIQFLISGDPKP